MLLFGKPGSGKVSHCLFLQESAFSNRVRADVLAGHPQCEVSRPLVTQRILVDTV